MDHLSGLLFLLGFMCLIQHANLLHPAPYHRSRTGSTSNKKIVVLKEISGMDPATHVRNFVSRTETSYRRLSPTGSFKVLDTFDKALCGFSFESDSETQGNPVDMLRSEEEVLFIEDVQEVTTQCNPSTPNPPPLPNEPSTPNDPNSVNEKWGLERIGERSLQLDGDHRAFQYRDNGGQGVNIYIVDSGVLANHREFGNRVSPKGYDALGKNSYATDCFGHGTHMAGIAAGRDYGVAPGATIHSVRVVDCLGKGTTDQLIKGLNWIANNFVHPTVVSISVATKGYSYSVNNAVENLVSRGLVVSVLAGNGGIDACATSPASARNAITVGATNNRDTRPTFSNFGSCVDIFAPGEDITSAWKSSHTSTKTDSGTSMACPHVSGAAAILLGRDKRLSPKDVKSKLLSAASNNVVRNPGRNSPNKLLYVAPL